MQNLMYVCMYKERGLEVDLGRARVGDFSAVEIRFEGGNHSAESTKHLATLSARLARA